MANFQPDYDLVVDDDSYIEITEDCQEQYEKINDKLITYLEILDSVCEDGISSGNLHDNILNFRENVSEVVEELEDLFSDISVEIQSFVPDIDGADDSFY